MKITTLNWFSITNWQELKFEYRLVEVSIEGGISEGKEFITAFHNALKYLASSTRGVVSEAYRLGKKYIAVRSDAELSEITIPGNPLDIILTPLPGTHTFDPATKDSENTTLAAKFIENAIEFQLNRKKNIWGGGNNSFLKKIPTKNSTDIQTDIYQGFKYRVHYQDGKMYVCIDLAYRYVDKSNLSEMLKHLPKEQWASVIEGRTFLYQNGDEWYTVKGKHVGGSISTQPLDKDDYHGTVYNYIKTKGRFALAQNPQPLDKNSETFYHSYSKTSTNTVAGAACLAKAIHFADNGLHKLSINEPHRRFGTAEFFAERYFQNLKFAGKTLMISTKPTNMDCRVLTMPSIKYRGNNILDPYAASGEMGSELYMYPRRRKEFAYKHGLLNEHPYGPQYLFVPDTLSYKFINSLKYYFERAMKQLDKDFHGFELIQYSMKKKPFANEVCREFQAMIAEKQLNGGSGLFILPDLEGNKVFSQYLHKLVKKELFATLNLKCISEKSLKRYMKKGLDKYGKEGYSVPDRLMQGFKSYQVNALFEYLIVNKKWPYALAEDLNYDLYIGLDAHEFYAGFVFLFKNGEKIVFDVERTSKSTGNYRNEKVNSGVIRNKIVEILSRHLRSGEDFPKSIVILRDGMSFGEEEKALTGAIEQLRAQGSIDDSEIKLAVLDVAKSSAIPVRAAVPNQNKILVNADCGTVVYTERNKDAYIFNTGYPYQVPGSSNPLHVTLAWGNIDFDKALQDVFSLTQLTFSAPDRPSSLPLPLKLIDTLIRDVAHEFDYANTQDKELKIVENAIKD